MSNILFIALGGALGAVARYCSYDMMMKLIRASNYSHFPFATIFVNVLGSFLAGALYYFMIKNFDSFDVRYKNFLMFGFLGAFTTFSAFSLDFMRLFTAGNYGVAFTYVFSSIFFSILAVFLGYYVMKAAF